MALVARLAKSAEDLGVLLWESAPVTSLTQDEAGVTGAVVKTARGDIRIRARKAVVLAAGGFANDIERRKALFPRTPTRITTPPSRLDCLLDSWVMMLRNTFSLVAWDRRWPL